MENQTPRFDVLPLEIQYKILSYLSYDELSLTRCVCKSFNQMCMNELNSGFHRVDKLRARIQKHVKACLPRRESERRAHVLSRHSDILAAIETRISLLSMTYSKFIELSLCCFIPGKVLDELFSVLRVIEVSKDPPSCSTLLQEFRDISSMAMEHFDEVIAPRLKKLSPGFLMTSSYVHLPSPSRIDGYMQLTEPTTPKQTMTGNADLQQQMIQLRQHVSSCISLINKKGKIVSNSMSLCRQKMGEYNQKLMEQDKVITSQNQKIQTLETKVTNLSRIVMELEQKYGDLTSSPSKSLTLPGCVCTVSSPNVMFNEKNINYSQGSESSGYGSQLDSSSVDGSSSKNMPQKCSKRKTDISDDKTGGELLFSPVAKRLRSQRDT